MTQMNAPKSTPTPSQTNEDSQSAEVSDYLLQQFEAIDEYEKQVLKFRGTYSPHYLKVWYKSGRFENFNADPEVMDLCKQLEKIVPLDHPYWSNTIGYRY